MKTLKKDLHVAYIIGQTVYMSNNNKIYKQFGLSTFNEKTWEEIESPNEEEMLAKLSKFKEENALKDSKRIIAQAEAEEQRKLLLIADREFALNIRKWRHNELECFLIRSYQSYADNDYNYNSFDFDCEIIFRKDEAKKRFEELKNSSEPNYGCLFVTEMLTKESSLDIIYKDDLVKYLNEEGEIIEENYYAPEIPEGNVVIELYHKQCGSSDTFNDAHYPNKQGWWRGNYWVKSETTTDGLKAFHDRSPSTYEIHLPLAEAIEKYRQDLIETLGLNKEDAVEAGVEDYLIEELFTE